MLAAETEQPPIETTEGLYDTWRSDPTPDNMGQQSREAVFDDIDMAEEFLQETKGEENDE